MDKREIRIERAKQTRLEKLETNHPVCMACPEDHWAVFEDHHVGGCRYCELKIRHCKNCHAKATALQKGHPPVSRERPTMEECIGRLLMGLADFFELLIKTLREYGTYLIETYGSGSSVNKAANPKGAT